MLVCAGILTVTLLKQSFRVSWSFGSHLTPTVTAIHISAVAVPSLSLMLCTFIQVGLPHTAQITDSTTFPHEWLCFLDPSHPNLDTGTHLTAIVKGTEIQ